MKKIIIGLLLGVILSVGIFLFDSMFNSREKISLKTAFITIKNESDFKINKILLKHGYGELFVSNIDIGKTVYLGFPNSSENSYTLTVKLENDSILESVGFYFEYGLRATETITNTEIITENNW